MKEPFELKGIWWLPQSPRKKISGILSYSPKEGCHLELFGVFYNEIHDFPPQPTIILGLTEDNKLITLFKCLNTSISIPIIGIGRTVYFAHFLFEGTHFMKEQDIQFSQLNISYENLDSWVGINGFNINYEQLENQIIGIQYQKPHQKVIKINESLNVGVDFSYTGPKMSQIQSETSISQNTFLFAQNNSGKIPFDDLNQSLWIFSYLFQISIQDFQNVVRFWGYQQIKSKKLKGRKFVSNLVNIYFSPIEYNENQKPINPQEMLFLYKDLDNQLIQKWFHNFDKVQSIVPLYRSIFYKKRLFIDNKFINIAQALESIHSVKFDNYYLNDEEYRQKVDEICKHIPSEYINWVKSVFSTANEKRFKQRIIELLEARRYIFSSYIDDNDLFAQKIRDTRNYFVHHTKQKYLLTDKGELIASINLMTILFESYLLDLIGFDDKIILEMLLPKLQTQKTGWKHTRSLKPKIVYE